MRQDDAIESKLDVLSSQARAILKINIATAYGDLVVTGDGNPDARLLLGAIPPSDLFTKSPVNSEAAEAVAAALWLWHDWLEQSHTISQQIASSTGSFWHAILHRREGDFSNSKYWYARCATHPVLPTLAVHSNGILNPLPADKSLLRLSRDGWDPAAFVDLVEQVHHNPDDPRRSIAIALQQLEWRLLFDHCTRNA